MAENGIDPLEHYASSGSDEGRFANAVFQSFESKEAWAISSNIGESEFEVFKDAAFSVVSTDGETEVAAIPFLIPLIYEGIKIIGIGLLSAEILNRVNNIQQLLDDDSANILWIPDSDELTKEGNLEQFPLPGFEEVSTATLPFDVGNVIGFDDNVFFPKGDGFLEGIVSGQFEFPLDDEVSFTYFLSIEGNVRGLESYGSLKDPNLTDYERTIGQSLSDEGNRLISVDDVNVKKTLGIPREDRAADYLSITPSGRFNITEVKGSEPGSTTGAKIGRAITQLDNTYKALVEKVPGAKLGKVEIAVPEGAPLGEDYEVLGNQIVRVTAEGTEVVRVGGKVVTIRR